MTYLAQAHANYDDLKSLIDRVGFKKSIRKLAETLPSGGESTLSGIVHTIINNHFDMEAYRGLTDSPLDADQIIQSPLFQNLGHCYRIAYANIITLLSSVSDRNYKFIPHPETWSESFQALREKRVSGYHNDSPVSLYPIGGREIFEGQARMAQLQYVHFATDGRLGLDAANEAKMLQGIYGKALSTFLQITALEPPSSIDHPTVALFLLICDIAINPGSAFPFPLRHFATFIRDIEPGARFVLLCNLARQKCPDVLTAIRRYSRDEYATVSQKLCEAMVDYPPLAIAEEFCRWSETAELRPLMTEYESFRFDEGNLAVRVLFSHFLAFMRDKFARPEFFCWPGAWMAGDKVDLYTPTLFDRHGALFVDKEDDDGIYPRLALGRTEKDVREVFQDFYAHNVIYHLTRQWIAEPGPFKYDFRWLSQKGTDEERQGFAEQCFRSLYGVNPSSAVVL